ncbi:Uma2 family endonuclease [Tissierella praeacuta]|uniref:Uma2 family endonuclease n=1 Tax=Tissierella praeacuta TaxID=43131 RepID=UPI0033415DD9
MSLIDENKTYTYADYLTWPEDERWEIMEGVPYMQAAPSWQHQSISLELSRQFANYLVNKTCKVFTAPFDLVLPTENKNINDSRNVVQPDILIICDSNGLKDTGFYGVPELIVEITSPSTIRKDKVLKFNKYEKAGVKEYWIVEPEGKFISVFTLEDSGRYGRPEIYTDEDRVKINLFENLEIDLCTVFNII